MHISKGMMVTLVACCGSTDTLGVSCGFIVSYHHHLDNFLIFHPFLPGFKLIRQPHFLPEFFLNYVIRYKSLEKEITEVS